MKSPGESTAKSIVVIGGGFAGLWSALSAARRLDELGVGPDEVAVTLINRDSWHAIRVRNYENDISGARVPLNEVLDPAGVRLVIGDVGSLDPAGRAVTVKTAEGPATLSYDRLILAAGSDLSRPDLPGLSQHAFSIDVWDDAAALDRHLLGLPDQPQSAARDTVLIIGGGLTGIELACEMPEKLRAVGLADGRVILADRNAHIGADMGAEARPVIAAALASQGVETRAAIEVAAIDETGAALADGGRIDAATVIWTAGMRASALAALLPVAHDGLGRVPVDAYMRVDGFDGVFAAGDIAAAPLEGGHSTVMSCQHARPMGRFAGHNAVGDLLGHEMLAMEIGYYVTCLDLGPWGALYTEGWERRVAASGPDVKKTKMTINREHIYPPRSGDRREILDAASPEVQVAPAGRDAGHTEAGG